MSWSIEGARLVDPTGEVTGGRLVVDGARIIAAESDLHGAVPAVSGEGLIVTPGFIDVHTHGGGGFSLQTEAAEEIRRYAAWAPSTGVTGFLVGVVGIPHAVPERQLRAAAEAVDAPGPGAETLGIHLEGPYINVKRRGAHEPSWMRMPDPSETELILDITRGHLTLVTLAPELPGATDMIRRLLAAGVTVSLGHTDADYEQALEAIALGVRHATHCFNAMPPLHHRAPGPIGAIVCSAEVQGELIADGVHVHPAVMRLLINALGPERVVVVTDALSVAGAVGQEFTFGGQPARVVDGAARLRDGTLTGSVLTMDQALRNLRDLLGVPLPEAVRMMTLNPARAAGVAERKGRLAPGYDADLAIFDTRLALLATYCRGELAYATDAWRERLARAR